MDEKLKEYIAKHTSKDTLDVDKFGEDLVKDYEEFDLFGGLFTRILLLLKFISFN